MKKIRITALALLCLVVGLAPHGARAAGPNLLVLPDGTPYKLDNSQPLTYNLDLGKLGTLSNTKAAIMVANAFGALQSVDTAKLSFEEGDPLEADVTGATIADFVNTLATDQNPVIFDTDGTVTDFFLGGGASFSELVSTQVLKTTGDGKIVQILLVLNGRAADGFFDPDDVNTPEFTRSVEAATMRALNVSRSDLNAELIFDGNVSNNSAVPVMYPGSVTGAGSALTLDDKMSLSMLYPADNFQASTGVIRGSVLLPDGTGLQGIDVIARSKADPINGAVSAITGARFKNTNELGSADPKLRGAFEIHVPPGTYTLEIRQLRAGIGPLQRIFPVPGGARFYQATPTAGPADPAQATEVTVTAGQATEVNITTGGQAAPAPQQVAEIGTLHDSPATAQNLPLSAVVAGNVSPQDPGSITLSLTGGGRDRVEDLYRIAVPQQSIVTLRLVPKEKVTLEMYALGGLLGGAVSGVDSAGATSTDPGALQLYLAAGIWHIGVSLPDTAQNPVPTAYTLEVTTTPVPEEAPLSRPVLDQLVVGNITATGAQAAWVTDRDATGDVLVAMPRQQFGDPNAAKTHQVAVTGLTAGAVVKLSALSQVNGARLDALPNVFFRTASQTPAQGPAKLTAAVIGQVTDFIGDDDSNLLTTRDVAIGIQNTGGDATNVQVTGLTASTGWKLATPVTAPISIGGIGSGGTAMVVVRLLRDGTGAAPIPTVTGTGTVTGADGNPVSFTLGGP